jgi:predicted small lipoprotein YifL
MKNVILTVVVIATVILTSCGIGGSASTKPGCDSTATDSTKVDTNHVKPAVVDSAAAKADTTKK